jgi:hypothetical protein
MPGHAAGAVSDRSLETHLSPDQRYEEPEPMNLHLEVLEERIAPGTVGALHNNPSNPNNNNDHNAVPNGGIPEKPAGK